MAGSKAFQNAQQKQRGMVRIIGKHVYGNLYGVNKDLLSDPNFLSKTVAESASVGNLHILELVSRKFDKYMEAEGGVSIIAIIKESHISVHTWPEGDYATVDVYSCGEASNPEKAFMHIVAMLKPKNYRLFKVNRSNDSYKS